MYVPLHTIEQWQSGIFSEDLLSIWCFPLDTVEEVQRLFSNNKAVPFFSTDVQKQEGLCSVM